MALKDENVQTLAQLGFTISQAKVFLALLRIEKATAGTISKHSKIARQEVYRVLVELQEKGLVEKIIATPAEFKPIPIKDFAHILIERKKTEVYEIQNKITELLWNFRDKISKNGLREEASQLVLLPEKEALILKLKKVTKTAQKSLDVYISLKALQKELAILGEEFQKALGKGVKIRCLVEKTDGANLFPEILQALLKAPSFKLRTLSQNTEQRFIVSDKKEVFFAFFPTRDPTDSPVLWSKNTSFSELLHNHFEAMWDKASVTSQPWPVPQ